MMTLSRTARILIAILLLAAAAFFWVNFFYRDGVSPVNVEGQPAPGTPGPEAGVTAPEAAENGDARAVVQGQPPGDGTPQADDGVAAPGDTPATVVIPGTTEVVTRDVNIADLPFLITEPPATPTPGEALGEADAGTGRQLAGQRVSVNPFSPIFIQAEAPAPTAPPTTQPTVTEVQVPGQPTGTATATGAPRVDAPAPRPLAPPSPRASDLPRQLPTGTPFGATPELLRQPLTMPEIAPGEFGEVATVRVPGVDEATADGRLPLSTVDITAAATTGDDAADQPLGPAERAAANGPQAPMVAGVDPLSRYLRDNNVVFTGSVLGTVSVGVFRSAESPMPLVVSLGQTLPETDIVLTDLTGLKAEFKLADSTQVLSLDLRR